MDEIARDALEVELRRRFAAGDLDGLIQAAIEGYGPELFGFLNGLTHDRARANDVFSAACERLWRGLPKFRWESSFRVWAYTIARNEFLRAARSPAWTRHDVPISEVASIQQAIERVRTTTPIYQQTAVRDRFAELREQLDPEDHMLLGLRIDRKLAWIDIAQVLGTGEAPPLPREVAALRKRFERLKARLRDALRER